MPKLLLPSILVALVWTLPAAAAEKATEGSEVVMNKLYPKKGRVEADTKLGLVLNSSYTQTMLANAGLTYFWSEEWGFNVEGNLAMVQDKNERKCIESFYNDPNYDLGQQCGADSAQTVNSNDKDANWGPAYVPIRKLKYMFTGNLIWNPIYGKQIVLLSATNYFDFYFGMGGGIAMSDFYPEQKNLPNGKPSRNAKFCTQAGQHPTQPNEAPCDPSGNPGTSDSSQIGEAGRPVPQSESNVLMHLSVGQRFHFLRRFLMTASLENYTLLGTEQGFDNFLTLMGGVGVRF